MITTLVKYIERINRYRHKRHLYLSHATWKDLAGSLYERLIESKENAISLLHHTDSNVRIAAINICIYYWSCATDSTFLIACKRLAASDVNESVRVHATCSYGRALSGSENVVASQFLADIITGNTTTNEVRMSAYWALREIHFGLTEEDSIKRTICLVKQAPYEIDLGLTEEQIKNKLLCHGRFPESYWHSANYIDWDFVDEVCREHG